MRPYLTKKQRYCKILSILLVYWKEDWDRSGKVSKTTSKQCLALKCRCCNMHKVEGWFSCVRKLWPLHFVDFFGFSFYKCHLTLRAGYRKKKYWKKQHRKLPCYIRSTGKISKILLNFDLIASIAQKVGNLRRQLQSFHLSFKGLFHWYICIKNTKKDVLDASGKGTKWLLK